LAAFASASGGRMLPFVALAIRFPASPAPFGAEISYCQNEGK
jgi:hypothetical protein